MLFRSRRRDIAKEDLGLHHKHPLLRVVGEPEPEAFTLLHENGANFAEWPKGERNRPFLSDNDEKVKQNAADFVTANGKAK